MSEALALLVGSGGEEHPRVAEVLLSLSGLVLSRGEVGRSRLLAAQALKIAEAHLADGHPIRVRIHFQLVAIYSDMRRYDDAENSAEIALRLGVPIWGEGSRFHMCVETQRSSNLGRQGRHAEARAMLEEIHGQINSRYPSLDGEVVNRLGLLRLWDGDFELAEQAFRLAIEIKGRPEYVDNVFLALWAQGRYSAALPFLEAVIENHEERLAMMWFPGRDDRKHETVGKFSWPVYRAVSFHATRGADEPMARDGAELAFLTILLRKGRIIEDSAMTTRARRETREPGLRALHEELIDARAELSADAILSLQGDSGARRRYLALADDTERLAAQLDDALLPRGTRVKETSLAALQAALPDDAAHIEYFRYMHVDRLQQRSVERRYVAYVLRRNSFEWFDLGAEESVHKHIKALRKALSFRRADVKTHAAAVYDLLLRPMESSLEGAASLSIAPDYELHQVPFAALYRRNDGYVIERRSVHYLNTARDLMKQGRTSDRGSDDVTVLANPGSARLPGAEDEARLIEMLFANTLALHGAQATERAMRAVRRPAILHVATHGVLTTQWIQRAGGSKTSIDINEIEEIAYQSMLRSTLVFAQSSAPEQDARRVEDGFMTAYELEDVDLLGTELVVLSACESGLGRALNLEGQLGLRRALVIAGSRSQLVSLWRVSDAATPLLMAKFYRGIAAGLSRRNALAESQRELLRDSGTSHPYYWASFTLYGDWGPLPALSRRGAAISPVRGCRVAESATCSEGALLFLLALAAFGISRSRRRVRRGARGASGICVGRKWRV